MLRKGVIRYFGAFKSTDNKGTRVQPGPEKYIVIVLIVLSATQIFLDSEGTVSNKYGSIIFVLDLLITGIFTIEYLIRLRYCGELNERFTGRNGRVRYITSFLGLVDLFSILPFYLYLLFPAGYAFLQLSRAVRILKTFRYLTSFRLIVNAIKTKKSELIISMQVVMILTFLLAVILFFVEHNAQHNAFRDVWSSIKWAVGKYINGIGGYGDYSPETAAGQFLATLVGFMGIALVAVPAGIIASGFVEEMQKMKKLKEIGDRISKLDASFMASKNSVLGIEIEPKLRTFPVLQTRLCYTQEEIIEATRYAKNLRLKWSKSSKDVHKFDVFVVEHFPRNTLYGFKSLKKDSRIFILNPTGRGEQGISHFTRCLADSLNASYLSNELYSSGDILEEHRCGFDTNPAYRDENKAVPVAFRDFKKDIREHIGSGDWVFIFKTSASTLQNQFHFLFGGKSGERGFEFPGITLNNPPLFREFYDQTKQEIQAEMNYLSGTHEHFGCSENQLHHYVSSCTKASVVTVFISINIIAYDDNNYYKLIRLFRDNISARFRPENC